MAPQNDALAPFLWRYVLDYVAAKDLLRLLEIHAMFNDIVSEARWEKAFLAREEPFAVISSPSKTPIQNGAINDAHFWRNAFVSKKGFASLQEAIESVDCESEEISKTQYYMIFVKPLMLKGTRATIEMSRTGLHIEIIGEGKLDRVPKYDGDREGPDTEVQLNEHLLDITSSNSFVFKNIVFFLCELALRKYAWSSADPEAASLEQLQAFVSPNTLTIEACMIHQSSFDVKDLDHIKVSDSYFYENVSPIKVSFDNGFRDRIEAELAKRTGWMPSHESAPEIEIELSRNLFNDFEEISTLHLHSRNDDKATARIKFVHIADNEFTVCNHLIENECENVLVHLERNIATRTIGLAKLHRPSTLILRDNSFSENVQADEEMLIVDQAKHSDIVLVSGNSIVKARREFCQEFDECCIVLGESDANKKYLEKISQDTNQRRKSILQGILDKVSQFEPNTIRDEEEEGSA
eukprot:TRINITY_DN425_c0_g7_i1.p1 TRINITY_DN425_c0_g7~~TRINITY_DN425_c0_g7_i1.p1  ORF type:complete len:466 (+),score=167.15 TRINITY_DN425_c0_g7_i1:38-1435(+)